MYTLSFALIILLLHLITISVSKIIEAMVNSIACSCKKSLFIVIKGILTLFMVCINKKTAAINLITPKKVTSIIFVFLE